MTGDLPTPVEAADTGRGRSETGLDPLAQRVSTGLAKVGTALRHDSWERAGRRGLHPAQAAVLSLLHSRRGGPERLGELARHLGVTAASASDSVSALVRKGLVEKQRVAGDARAVGVVLTEAGRDETDAAAEWPDLLAEIVDELTPEEQTVLLRGLVKMIRALQERGRVPVARMCVTCRHFAPFVHPGPDRPHHCRFIDAAFGEAELRIDCHDQQPLDPGSAEGVWRVFLDGGSGLTVEAARTADD